MRRLKTEVRWNSTVKMVDSILEQKDIINAALLNADQNDLCLDDLEINVLESLTQLLFLFLDATNELQEEKKCTVRIVIPTIMALFRGAQSLNFEDSAAVNAVKQASVQSLEKRFGLLKDSKVHILATILDPNTKFDFVGDNSNFLNFNKLDCQTVFMDYFSTKLPCESFSETQIVDTCPEKRKRPRLQDFKYPICEKQRSSDYYDQIACYAKSPTGASEDIIKFWKEYPKPIQNIVFEILSVSPDTSTVERVFSAAGYVLCKTRARMLSPNLENLMMLKVNRINTSQFLAIQKFRN